VGIENEVPLAGGKLNPVVRVRDTVRRPGGPWTPTVHALLEHVHQRGFTYGPRPLGIDDQGREMLSYIPGDTVGVRMPWPQWVWNEQLLAEVGRATAAYHRAVQDFRPPAEVEWFFGSAPLLPGQIVCHHDIAPYNVVVDAGSLRGIIDWDLAGPGSVRSEVAFVAWQWVPLHDPIVTGLFGWTESPDRVRRLRILLDSYGLTDRRGFIADVMARIEFNRDVIINRARAGDAAYIALEQEGHVWGMNQALAFLQLEGDALQAQVG
jgi:Phosphotransferase enzyme family